VGATAHCGQRRGALLEGEPLADADRELAPGEQLDQAGEAPAVRDHEHRPHGDPALGFRRVRRDGGEPAAITDRRHRHAGSGARGVRGRIDAAAGQRAHPLWPVRLLIVQNGRRAHRGQPGGAVGAGRGDDRCPAVCGQLDQHAPGHPAGPVDEDGLPWPNLQGVTDHLVGGQGRDRQRPGCVGRHTGLDRGDVPGGGDEPLGPGPLLAQRHRMGGDPVAGLERVHLVPDGDDDPGRLDAQGHRRAGAEIPASGTGNVVPVAHPAGVHVEQDLIRPQRTRSRQLEQLDRIAEPAHSRGSHGSIVPGTRRSRGQ